MRHERALSIAKPIPPLRSAEARERLSLRADALGRNAGPPGKGFKVQDEAVAQASLCSGIASASALRSLIISRVGGR
jgi:hypothetical protein